MSAPTNDESQTTTRDLHLETPCPLCASRVPLPDLTADSEREPADVRHARCPTCHAIIPIGPDGTAADRDPEDLAAASRRLADAAVTDGSAVAWSMAEHLPQPGPGVTIVDLGMRRGGIANALIQLGYTVTGCEPSAFLCQLARASYLLGPDTLTNTDPLTFLADRRAGAAGVVLWHVVDRHEQPTDVLRGAVELARGGMLLVQFEIAGAGPGPAGERFHPTPATLLHLAEEFGLVPVTASVEGGRSLRVFYEVPEDGIVDLDQDDRLDLDALDAAYRAASPVFADLVPDPASDHSADTDTEIATGTETDPELEPARSRPTNDAG